MRFLCWAIFCLLLGSSAGWSLEEEVNIIVDKTLYVMRDRYGIRPLCIGHKEDKVYVITEKIHLNNLLIKQYFSKF